MYMYTGLVLALFLLSVCPSTATRTCVDATNVTCSPEYCTCQTCRALGLWVTCRGNDRIPDDLPPDTVALHLEYNELRHAGGALLSRLKKLRLLDLSHNHLELDQVSVLQGLSSVEHLYLDHNTGTSAITDETLRPLTSLTVLRISASYIEHISRHAFRHNTKLRRLALNDNRLTFLPEPLFRDLPSLIYVGLSYNSLRFLPRQMFSGSPNVRRVYVANNQLSAITPDVGLQDLANLTALSVSNNPFHCACDLVWFHTWVATTDVGVLTENVKCTSGLNFTQFDPGDLQCDFPVGTVFASCLCVIAVSALCVLLFIHRWRVRYLVYEIKRKIWRYEELKGEEDEFKYDAFISHSSKDEDWVHGTLRPTLEGPPHNYRLCLDFRDFIVGETIADNIIQSVDESRKTVFVVTNDFIESEWCYFELEMVRQKMFDEHRDLAVIILKENVSLGKMPGLLQYLMRRGNHIEWSDNRHAQNLLWAKLGETLKKSQINMV